MRRMGFIAALLAFTIMVYTPLWSSAKSADRSGRVAEAPSKTMEVKATTTPLDLNTASVDQLKELPGIGDALAKKIVGNRPYRSKDELVRRKVIPTSTYDKIKGDVVARQATAKTK